MITREAGWDIVARMAWARKWTAEWEITVEPCVKTVALGNEKITFGIEVTDEKMITIMAVLHTVAWGSRWHITRAVNVEISTRLCLYGLKESGQLKSTEASNTESRALQRWRCNCSTLKRHKRKDLSGCIVAELELRERGGLQGAHSPLWPQHS